MELSTKERIKNAVESDRARRYYDFMVDMYVQCREGYRPLAIKDYCDKHKVSNTAVQEMYSKNLLGYNGGKNVRLYHWKGGPPSLEMAYAVREAEMQKSNLKKANNGMKKTRPSLVPIIIDDKQGCLNKEIHKVYVECTDGALSIREQLESATSKDTVERLVKSGFLVTTTAGMMTWNDERGDDSDAFMVLSKAPKDDEDPGVKHRVFLAMQAIHESLQDGTQVVHSILREFKLPPTVVPVMTRMGILKAYGPPRARTFRWVNGQPTMDDANRVHITFNALVREYQKKHKEERPMQIVEARPVDAAVVARAMSVRRKQLEATFRDDSRFAGLMSLPEFRLWVELSNRQGDSI